ncbi:MAG: hypothetical protein J5I98_10235 [Phaeodactylibacter sp.]|nr:hypothetical protein [Phaeodactylibacter sp.]
MKIERRETLRLLSFSGAAALLGLKASESKAQCLTTDDILGPFYIPGAPETPQLAPAGAPGTPLFITGTVYARDCETPVQNAKVDVWHANDGGGYEDDHYRGVVFAGENGQYSFQTILPGKYLNGAQFRPRHFHYKVSAMDTELTTQIYFEGDTSIPADPWASSPAAAERIIPLSEDQSGNLHGVADIYLDLEPLTNSQEGQGFSPAQPALRHIVPNPMATEGRVQAFLPVAASVSLLLFNLNGKLAREIIRNQRLPAGMHQWEFRAETRHGLRLQPGVYILQLQAGGRPADSKRFIVI